MVRWAHEQPRNRPPCRGGSRMSLELSAGLDLGVDAVSLTEALVDIESVSGNEEAIADAVEAALRRLTHLEVSRFGNTVVARTDQGHAERVVIAGHLDTVP